MIVIDVKILKILAYYIQQHTKLAIPCGQLIFIPEINGWFNIWKLV